MRGPNNTTGNGGGLRLDQLAVELCGDLCKSMLEPQFKNVPLWDHGLKAITQEAVRRAGVPTREVTALDFAKGLGLFK